MEDIELLRQLGVTYINDLMVEGRKVKYVQCRPIFWIDEMWVLSFCLANIMTKNKLPLHTYQCVAGLDMGSK